MKYFRALLYVSVFGSVLAFTGCLATPQPVLISRAPGQIVELRYDAKAGAGHAHPAAVSAAQLTAILKGVHVQARDVIGAAGMFAGEESEPAFTDKETGELAPYLAAGLAKASPVDVVTFYLARRDSNKARLVTSGGLFVRNHHLYIVLANVRTSRNAIQYETTYEPDTLDNPLLPITRFKFLAGFMPADWRVPTADAKRMDGWDGYLDESKVVVIDLTRRGP